MADLSSHSTVNGIGMTAIALNGSAPGFDVLELAASDSINVTPVHDQSLVVAGYAVNTTSGASADAPLTQIYGADVGSTSGSSGHNAVASAGLSTYFFSSNSLSGASIGVVVFGPVLTPVEEAPVFAANPITGSDATEDAAYSGTLAGSATDANGDALS